MPLFLALLLAAVAPAAEPTFDFVGQPDCVTLTWEGDGHTLLENACDHPLLLDQSVQLPSQRIGLVPAGATTRVRDLSAFTLGAAGRLYRVRAVLLEPEPAELPPEDTGLPNPTGVRL